MPLTFDEFLYNYPERAKSLSGMSEELSDDALIAEYPGTENFYKYVNHAAEKIILSYIRYVSLLPGMSSSSFDELTETWEESGLKDEIMVKMVGIVLVHLGLYTPLTMKYFMLHHFNKRLDVRQGLDILRNEALAQLQEIGLSQEMIDIMNFLADLSDEQVSTRECLEGYRFVGDRYHTIFPEFLNPGFFDCEEFIKRRIFLEKESRGRMLGYFTFVLHFDRSKDIPSDKQGLSDLIYQVFLKSPNEIATDPKYLEFKADPEGFAERLYKEWLNEEL